MKTIAIANHKGGCAKTTTALNLAVTLANTGSRVLAVDLDPQGNLSAAVGADLQELNQTLRGWYTHAACNSCASHNSATACSTSGV